MDIQQKLLIGFGIGTILHQQKELLPSKQIASEYFSNLFLVDFFLTQAPFVVRPA